ncbi:hypothetical protein L083_3334 [Actinoplanes sp. N902-109]|nr:hypothetical protein L083_3334 [Actinoplanes sp. N902-109]
MPFASTASDFTPLDSGEEVAFPATAVPHVPLPATIDNVPAAVTLTTRQPVPTKRYDVPDGSLVIAEGCPRGLALTGPGTGLPVAPVPPATAST